MIINILLLFFSAPICGTFKNYNVDHLAENGAMVLYFNSTRDYFNSSDYRYKGFTVTYTSYTDSESTIQIVF